MAKPVTELLTEMFIQIPILCKIVQKMLREYRFRSIFTYEHIHIIPL